jgi:hypothetical protein
VTDHDELSKNELAQRARRPSGVTQACRNCYYWDFSRHDAKQLENEAGEIFSDVRAECRRHAPRPTEHNIHHMTQLLGLIAWAAEEAANVRHEDPEDHYGAEGKDEFYVHEWPHTGAHDWCGEFVRRT